jgi:hypothetical protein
MKRDEYDIQVAGICMVKANRIQDWKVGKKYDGSSFLGLYGE